MIPKSKQAREQKRPRPVGPTRLKPPKGMSSQQARNLTAKVRRKLDP
jgi:hypothetical protein